jgi:hypothetical protein
VPGALRIATCSEFAMASTYNIDFQEPETVAFATERGTSAPQELHYLGEFELIVMLTIIRLGEDAYGVPITFVLTGAMFPYASSE